MLCLFSANTNPCPVKDHLHHLYVATTIVGGTALLMQRDWKEVGQEEALVDIPSLPPVQEGVDTPSPATRFLS